MRFVIELNVFSFVLLFFSRALSIFHPLSLSVPSPFPIYLTLARVVMRQGRRSVGRTRDEKGDAKKG